VRLIEPARRAGYASAAHPAAGGLALAPLYHLFGSEELSARAGAAEPLVPELYVALHPQDAARLGLGAAARVRVEIGATVFEAPLRLRDTLARGTLGVPVGLPSLPWLGDGEPRVSAGGS
jgi:NADH-quinone oxidoreductase subunit G